jgi:hypothetical protein
VSGQRDDRSHAAAPQLFSHRLADLGVTVEVDGGAGQAIEGRRSRLGSERPLEEAHHLRRRGRGRVGRVRERAQMDKRGHAGAHRIGRQVEPLGDVLGREAFAEQVDHPQRCCRLIVRPFQPRGPLAAHHVEPGRVAAQADAIDVAKRAPRAVSGHRGTLLRSGNIGCWPASTPIGF